MKRINISDIFIIILIFFTILLINIPSDLSAQEDTTPPELVEVDGFDFDPKAIDVSSGTQVVFTRFHITDNLSGLVSASVLFCSPSENFCQSDSTWNLVSGTLLDGVYEGQVHFPQFIEAGTYRIKNISLNDRLGNSRKYFEADLVAMGFPTELEVNSTSEDTTPPELVEVDGFDFDPKAIDVSSGTQVVFTRFHITDNLSGLVSASVLFCSPSENFCQSDSTWNLVSGTLLDGVYEGQVHFPQFIEAGTYRIKNISLNDRLGNSRKYFEADLVAMGFPTELEVNSTSEDTTPPELVEVDGFDFDPKAIDVSSGTQVVFTRFHITDNLSGLVSASVLFCSPSENFCQSDSTWNLVSGTLLDGVYEGQVHFPQFIETGTYRIKNISLNDRLGNSRKYFEADLIAMGFPTELEVISVSNDTTPPELVEMDFIPKSIDVSISSEDITITLRIRDELSGLGGASVVFESPSGVQRAVGLSDPISGDRNDGVYQATMSFPQFSEQGMWRVEQVTMIDAVSNRRDLSETDLSLMGFLTELQVESTIDDTISPELIAFDFTPKSIDVSSGSEGITTTLRIRDELSGLAAASVVFESPSGIQKAVGLSDPISGDRNDGVYQATMSFPQFSEQGMWRVEQVTMIDAVSNRPDLSETDLSLMGFPTELQVESTIDDTTSPELIAFDFTPKSIDVSSGSEDITTTLRIRDELSGLAAASVVFESPSGIQKAVGLSDPISGDRNDGVYQATMSFPQFSEQGMWRVEQVTMIDAVSNRRDLSETDLSLMGFPTELEVVYIEDSDGDSIPDNQDACRKSDLTETVIIDGWNTGVDNVLLEDGCTISDIIAECVEAADNHGEFVNAVSHTTNALKKEGIISGKDKGMIQKGAAKADFL